MPSILQKHHDGLALAGGAMMVGYIVCAALLLGQYLGAL
jgi:hypothetical protein